MRCSLFKILRIIALNFSYTSNQTTENKCKRNRLFRFRSELFGLELWKCFSSLSDLFFPVSLQKYLHPRLHFRGIYLLLPTVAKFIAPDCWPLPYVATLCRSQLYPPIQGLIIWLLALLKARLAISFHLSLQSFFYLCAGRGFAELVLLSSCIPPRPSPCKLAKGRLSVPLP